MIQDAILEKCIENGAGVVHIAVDKSSSEVHLKVIHIAECYFKIQGPVSRFQDSVVLKVSDKLLHNSCT